MYDAAYWAKRQRRAMRPWNRLRFTFKRAMQLRRLLAERDELRVEYASAGKPADLRDVLRELDADIASARRARAQLMMRGR